MTAAAEALNTLFFGFDSFILTALSKIACPFLTWFFKLITFLGEDGIIFFLLAVVFMLFRKTRPLGVCLFGAVGCGALITNIILKDAIARPRPFETVELFRQYWQAIGSPAEEGYSFPSGHVTAAAAGAVAIRLMKGRKWTVPAIAWIVLMMLARNYLMAHYPSDVWAAAIIGTGSAFIAYFITKLIFRFLDECAGKFRWAAWILDFDLPEVLPAGVNLPKFRTSSKSGYKGKHEK